MPTQEILCAVKAVRPLPDVAHRVLRIVQNADYAIDDLVSVVRTDPTLVARVLRLCNSARSGLDTEITSILDAIAFLGSRNLVQLVLVTCTAGMFAGTRGSRYSDPTTLWQHSIACAFACQALATRTGEAVAATAFTLGILHDVGKIAMSRVADEGRFLAVLSDSASVAMLDHVALEQRAFGIDHATAAGLVAAAWQLPPTLTGALRSHHDDQVFDGEDALPAILHVADTTVLRAGIGNSFPTATTVLHEAALTRLGLRTRDLEALSDTLSAELAKAADLLNLDLAASR